MGNLVIHNSNTFITVPEEMTVSEIRESLPAASHTEVSKAVAMLFTARKSANRGDDDAEMVAQVYVLAIQEYPAYAIEAAVMAIIKGKAPNIAPTFVPSTDEFCSEIERQMWLRIRKVTPHEMPETVLPDNHLKRKWELLQGDLMKTNIVTDELNGSSK